MGTWGATLSRQPLDRLCLNTQTDSSDLTQSPRWQTASNPSRCERASSSETPSSAASKWSLTSSTPTVPTSPRMNSVAARRDVQGQQGPSQRLWSPDSVRWWQDNRFRPRVGFASKIEKPSRQQRKQRKNRQKTLRGTAKVKGASKKKDNRRLVTSAGCKWCAGGWKAAKLVLRILGSLSFNAYYFRKSASSFFRAWIPMA